jgi:hypothetical protein
MQRRQEFIRPLTYRVRPDTLQLLHLAVEDRDLVPCKKRPLFSGFPMFVPSLSWIDTNGAKKAFFAPMFGVHLL